MVRGFPEPRPSSSVGATELRHVKKLSAPTGTSGLHCVPSPLRPFHAALGARLGHQACEGHVRGYGCPPRPGTAPGPPPMGLTSTADLTGLQEQEYLDESNTFLLV